MSRRGAEIAESELAPAFGYGLKLKKNLVLWASFYGLALQNNKRRCRVPKFSSPV
jgi:hypothetical protein